MVLVAGRADPGPRIFSTHCGPLKPVCDAGSLICSALVHRACKSSPCSPTLALRLSTECARLAPPESTCRSDPFAWFAPAAHEVIRRLFSGAGCGGRVAARRPRLESLEAISVASCFIKPLCVDVKAYQLGFHISFRSLCLSICCDTFCQRSIFPVVRLLA